MRQLKIKIQLNDRLTDIYQNYSLCENNCQFNSINLTRNTASCNCSVKTYSKNEVEKPNGSRFIF